MRVRQYLFFIHQWTGLLTGVNILIASVTGAYLVFSEELEQAFGPPPGPVAAQVDMKGATPIQDAFDSLAALHPGALPAQLYRPRNSEAIWIVGVRDPAGSFFRYILDEKNGTLCEKTQGTNWSVWLWMIRLHGDLFRGGQGFNIMGGIAILFVISTLTGLLIYAPYMKAAAFGTLRFGRGTHRAAADLHLLIGAASLGFNLLIGLTGIAITLGLILIRDWQTAAISANVAADKETTPVDASRPPMDVLLHSGEAAWAGVPVSSVVFPGAMQGPNHFLFMHGYPGAITVKVPKFSLVPLASPQQATAIPVPWWVTVLSLGVPLHFGDFAGLGMKIAYFFLGLTSGALSITGALMTISRWTKRWQMRWRTRAAARASLPKESS